MIRSFKLGFDLERKQWRKRELTHHRCAATIRFDQPFTTQHKTRPDLSCDPRSTNERERELVRREKEKKSGIEQKRKKEKEKKKKREAV